MDTGVNGRSTRRLVGESLIPLVHRSGPGGLKRGAFVVSQFHGDNIAMSWFMIVKKMDERRTYKLIVYGTGTEVPAQLFELNSDPDEMTNLASSAPSVVADLDASLRTIIDYPSVARDVARYNVDSFAAWVHAQGDAWRDAIHAPYLRWSPSFNDGPLNASLAAIELL